MILILSDSADPSVRFVTKTLATRGAASLVLDPAALLAAGSLAVTIDPVEGRTRLRALGRSIEMSAVSCVWLWRPSVLSEDPRIVDAQARRYALHEWAHVLTDLWHGIPARWIPAPPTAVAVAERKLRQLSLAKSLGFAVPDTRVTNDTSEALDFISEQEADIVTKAPSTALVKQVKDRTRYTLPFAPRDVASLEALPFAPAMFQAQVPKRFELRVTVVGERVFAAEIHSQAARRTRADWRNYDLSHTPHAVHELPAAVAQRCVALTRALGVCYGALDLVYTPDGEYVFLEINPNGQFGWIEDLTGLPITEALCDLMLSDPRAQRAAFLEATA